MTEYKVLKRIKVGKDWHNPGDSVKGTDDHDWARIVNLGLAILKDGDDKEQKPFTPKAIKETPKEPTSEPNTPLTNLDNRANNTSKEPVIKPAGKAWFKVYLGDEVLGKAVRTKEEAQEIIDEWRKNQK